MCIRDREINLRFRRPATGDIQVEARLSPEAIAHLEEQASQQCKAEYLLELQLTDGNCEVIAESRGHYQLRLR